MFSLPPSLLQFNLIQFLALLPAFLVQKQEHCDSTYAAHTFRHIRAVVGNTASTQFTQHRRTYVSTSVLFCKCPLVVSRSLLARERRIAWRTFKESYKLFKLTHQASTRTRCLALMKWLLQHAIFYVACQFRISANKVV